MFQELSPKLSESMFRNAGVIYICLDEFLTLWTQQFAMGFISQHMIKVSVSHPQFQGMPINRHVGDINQPKTLIR